jgi:Tol biopolymer transport system component
MRRAHLWPVVAGALLLSACSPFGGSDGSSGLDSETALRAHNIYSIEPDGSDRRDVTRTAVRDENLVSISPDGSRIAYVLGRYAYDQRGRLYVADADGHRRRDLGPAATGPEFAGAPVWSPDGRMLAFTNAVGCDEVVCEHWQLWVVDVDSGARRRIASDGVEPAWSPDGRFIAYNRATLTPGYVDRQPELIGKSALVVAHADGSAARVIAPNASSPAWSPSGDRIAYLTRGGLVVARPDGDQPLVVAKEGGPPVWSPEGDRLAFIGGLPAAVFVVGADGSGLRRLAEVGARFIVVWSPDGARLAWLAFLSVDAPGHPNATELVVGAADGSGSRTITDEPFGARIDSLAWTGERLYYSAARLYLR